MKENIKSDKGITLVSLVVTIIILIILAGVSINMTLGEGGIITIAKRAKENMELAQIEEQKELNELYSKIEQNGGIIGGEINYDVIAKLNNFKKAIADYIEEAGGIKPDYTADAETFGERIKGIVKEVTKNATATEEDILEGKTAWVNGKLIEGKKSDIISFNSISFKSDYGWSKPNKTFNVNLSSIDNFQDLVFESNLFISITGYFGDTDVGYNANYNNSTGILTITMIVVNQPAINSNKGIYGFNGRVYYQVI